VSEVYPDRVLDLSAYLQRIGVREGAPIAEITRGHLTSIPFENLDPQRGVPISLEPEDIHRKLVTDERGGYCFEHNLLLAQALEAIGAQVELLLARVRFGGVAPGSRTRSHLILRVRDGSDDLHADVGFGRGSLLEPIPFGIGGPYERAGWRFRVVRDGDELVLQRASSAEGWDDLYGFLEAPVPRVDVEMSNWFTCTNPRSRFVTGLFVGAHTADGTVTVLNDWSGELTLTVETPHATTVTPVERSQVPELLATRFGLQKWVLRGDERVELSR
jgi:N-hydroxyarylamine O-acetyltransferase